MGGGGELEIVSRVKLGICTSTKKSLSRQGPQREYMGKPPGQAGEDRTTHFLPLTYRSEGPSCNPEGVAPKGNGSTAAPTLDILQGHLPYLPTHLPHSPRNFLAVSCHLRSSGS